MRVSLREPRGVSLIECLIVMAVMGIILGAAHLFITSGVDFYRRSIQSLEVQQQTLVGLSKMASEVADSNFDKIHVLPAPNNDGIIFPSPARLDGTMATSAQGVMLWHTIVCYRQRTLPNNNIVIERKVDVPAWPLGVPGVDYPPDPLTIGGGARDFPYFAPLSAQGIMVRNVAPSLPGDPGFEVVLGTDLITITLKVVFSQRTKDTMKVSTVVVPRN